MKKKSKKQNNTSIVEKAKRHTTDINVLPISYRYSIHQVATCFKMRSGIKMKWGIV